MSLPAIDTGSPIALAWGLPFAGLLLSVAVAPLLAPRLWHRRMGTAMAVWAAALLVPQAVLLGLGVAIAGAWHALLVEYLPFMALLLALFTAGSGILLEGGPWGTPRGNTALLAIGTLLAGLMGTTGVSMVLIHPLLRANAYRRRRAHLVVFFIVLCANAGGVTSPLGDPPLYIGFLHGVPFGWPLAALSLPLLVLAVPLLGGFYALDSYFARREPPAPLPQPLRVRGGWNLALIGCVIGCVLVQGVWDSGAITLLGQAIDIDRLLGAGLLLGVAALSWRITPTGIRQGNMFTWAPMVEVAQLFAGMFITVAPVLAMLQQGRSGPLAGLIDVTFDAGGQPWPLAYFWLTGAFAAVLDNAPTYLLFIQVSGGDPVRLVSEGPPILRAISAGAVFFGGLTYFGNAPNMIVRSIAVHRGIRMPGFFAYSGWACLLLLPMFIVLSLVFFRNP